MKLINLPDGTTVTTPVYLGPSPVPPQCEKHEWEDEGISHLIPEAEPDKTLHGKTSHFQKCKVCGWQRLHIR